MRHLLVIADQPIGKMNAADGHGFVVLGSLGSSIKWLRLVNVNWQVLESLARRISVGHPHPDIGVSGGY